MNAKALDVHEKRWRAMPRRVLRSFSARLPGAASRFRHALAEAVAAPPAERLQYYVSFTLAEHILGDAAIIDADPRSIDRLLFSEAKSEERLELPRDYFLIDGSWDPLTRSLERSRLDGEVREFIGCHGEFRQTSAFRMLSQRLNKEGRFHRNGVLFRNQDDVEAYCRHHLRLIESIRMHGVVRRAELAKIGKSAGRLTPNAAFLERVETDAAVAVGPGGALLRYRGGFHRTAAARELGLRIMPVQVKLIHLEWLRDQVKDTGLSAHEALIEGLRRLSVSAGAS